MSRDDLDRLFSEYAPEVPPVPASLLATTRLQANSARADWRRTMRTRALVAVAVVVGLAVASLTPPGRAAAEWLRDIAGFGEAPTLEQVGSVEDAAVVVDSGQLSDGTPYEAVLKRLDTSSFPPEPEVSGHEDTSIPNAVCLQIDWIESQRKGQGGICTQGKQADESLGQEAATVFTRPEGADNAPGLLFGYVENPDATDVRVVETSHGQHELPVQVIEINGDLRQAIGLPFPAMVFIAPIDGEVIASGETGGAQVTASSLDANGRLLGEIQAFSPPFGCEEPVPGEPAVAPPAGTAKPVPATPAEMKTLRPTCPGVRPVPVSEFRLNVHDVPASVLDGAAATGHPLVQAQQADYPPLFEPSSQASSVDHAARVLSQSAVDDLLPDSVETGVRTSQDVYLARLAEGQKLVYVGQFTALGLTGPDHPDEDRVGEIPATFIGIFDVASGKQLALQRVDR